MTRIAVACLLMATLFTSIAAASPRGFTERFWGTQNGLPEETVQAFAQTPDRYLWIGTTGGLVRFDGDRFVVFDRDNTRAFAENSVFCLLVSRDGSLWVGTDGGGLVRYKDSAFTYYRAESGLSNEFVRAIYEDRSGNIYAGTDRGLFRFRNKRFERVDGRDGVPAIAVHAIVNDSAGNLWVGGSKLLRFRGSKVDQFELEGGTGQNRIKSLAETKDGAIWVGTVSGLQRSQPAGLKSTPQFFKIRDVARTVRVLYKNSGDRLWAATIGAGIREYSDGESAGRLITDSLPSKTVLALFEDRERNIWVGTQAGMLRLSKTAITTVALPGAADNDFGTIYEDRDRKLWIASTHLFRLSGSQMVPYRVAGLPAPIRVRMVFRDSRGAVWFGTDGAGVFREQGHTLTNFSTRQGLVNDFTRAILETRDGSIWIGTDDGLSRMNGSGIVNYQMNEGLAYFSVRALLEDRHGDLWIGTQRGVSHLRAGVFIHDEPVERLKSEKVSVVHEDADGGLWFGTRGGGLFRWRDGKLIAFTATDGLASNRIYQVMEDPRHNFWMSGPNGISMVNRSDLDAMALDSTRRPSVKLYGISDGLDTTQMFGGFQPAGCITSAGEVWFPSGKGPVRIVPGADDSPDLPPVVVEQVLADDRNIPPAENILVPPGNGKLEIHYVAIRLRSQERIRYKYKLEGFDETWNQASSRRVAYYTNLPARPYKFRVATFEMSNPDVVSETLLSIDLKPHFYRTVWFLALCVVLIASSAWGVYVFRLNQVSSRFKAVLGERNRVAREMHDTVLQGCASISAILEALWSMWQQDRQVDAALLDCARTQVRTTIVEARRAVWDLRDAGQPDSKLASLLPQLAERLRQENQVAIRCEIAGKPFPFDPRAEHDLLMVIREAAHNAIRHAEPDEIQIRLTFEKRLLKLLVSDDGRGFDVDETLIHPDGHCGITGMRERIVRLGGNFNIESCVRGTTVRMSVPRAKFSLEEVNA